MGSNRFPGKVLTRLSSYSIIELIYKRLTRSKYINSVVLATSTDIKDDPLVKECVALGLEYYRGSATNVLDRTYQAALKFKADRIVRITADCPFVDPEIIDFLLLCSNLDPECDFIGLSDDFPDGLDSSIILTSALNSALLEATLSSDLEHTAPYIENNRNGNFKVRHINIFTGLSEMRITLDHKEDLAVLDKLADVISHLDIDLINVTAQLLISIWRNNSEIFQANKDIIRNEGYLLSLRKDLSI